jgi:hypothetical protein
MPLNCALRTLWTTTGQRLQRGLLRQHFFFGFSSASLLDFTVVVSRSYTFFHSDVPRFREWLPALPCLPA